MQVDSFFQWYPIVEKPGSVITFVDFNHISGKILAIENRRYMHVIIFVNTQIAVF
jgi:hypothetical protein